MIFRSFDRRGSLRAFIDLDQFSGRPMGPPLCHQKMNEYDCFNKQRSAVDGENFPGNIIATIWSMVGKGSSSRALTHPVYGKPGYKYCYCRIAGINETPARFFCCCPMGGT